MWERAGALDALRPPNEVVVCLHAGDLVVLGCLSDEDLVEIGLTEQSVRAAIDAAPSPLERSADRLHAIWSASRTGDMGWVELIARLLPEEPHWKSILGAHWSLYNAYFDEQHLNIGRIGTRVNTLLEIASTDATAGDHQVLIGDLATSIADGKLSTFQNRALFGSMLLAGGVVGFFTGGAGAPLVGRAGSWIDGSLRSVDDWVADLALHWFLASMLAQDDPIRYRSAADQLHQEALEIGRAGRSPQAGRHFRMLMAAYSEMMDGQATAEAARLVVPDVTGLRLNDAKALLQSTGLRPAAQVDAAPPAEGPRSTWSESRWMVRAQHPPAGTEVELGAGVQLAFSRPDERVRAHEVMSRLRELA